MDTRQGDSREHDLIRSLIFGCSVAAVRHYARAYLDRSRPGAGRLFFRKTDRMLIGGILGFLVVFGCAMLVSYASLGLAFAMVLISLVMAAFMIIPPQVLVLRYASRELQIRRQERGPLADRLYQTGHDYAPRIFP